MRSGNSATTFHPSLAIILKNYWDRRYLSASRATLQLFATWATYLGNAEIGPMNEHTGTRLRLALGIKSDTSQCTTTLHCRARHVVKMGGIGDGLGNAVRV